MNMEKREKEVEEKVKEIYKELVGAFNKKDVEELEELNKIILKRVIVFTKEELEDEELDLEEYIKIEGGGFEHKLSIEQKKVANKIVEDLEQNLSKNWIFGLIWTDLGEVFIGLDYNTYKLFDTDREIWRRNIAAGGRTDFYLGVEEGDKNYIIKDVDFNLKEYLLDLD